MISLTSGRSLLDSFTTFVNIYLTQSKTVTQLSSSFWHKNIGEFAEKKLFAETETFVMNGALDNRAVPKPIAAVQKTF